MSTTLESKFRKQGTVQLVKRLNKANVEETEAINKVLESRKVKKPTPPKIKPKKEVEEPDTNKVLDVLALVEAARKNIGCKVTAPIEGIVKGVTLDKRGPIAMYRILTEDGKIKHKKVSTDIIFE